MKLLIFLGAFISVLCGLIQADDSENFPESFDLANLDGKNGLFLNGPDKRNDCSIVRRVGDINGDGIDDIFVGIPTVGDKNNLAYIVFGSKKQWPKAIGSSDLNGRNGFIVMESNYLALSISGAGDFNGDGIADILIGQPGINNIYIIFGSKKEWPQVFKTSDLNGQNGLTLLGTKTKFSGGTLSGIGDVNKDDIDDIIIGAIDKSYIIFGNKGPWPAKMNLDNSSSKGCVILYPANGFRSLSGTGDVNGDGIDDILIGSYGQEQQSYVLFGKEGSWPETIKFTDLNGKNGFTINGTFRSSYGNDNTVSRAGDINGDGIDDIIMSDSRIGQSVVIFGSKKPWPVVIKLSDLNGVNGFVINGTSILPYGIDNTVSSGAGDFNGDGIDDVLIGMASAKNRNGQSYILFGSNKSWPAVFNLSFLNGSNGFAMNGISNNEQSGCSVNGAGDINGDGYDDILIGAFGGQSYIVFGNYEITPPTFPDNAITILEVVFGIGGGIVLTVCGGYFGYQYYQHSGYATIEASSDLRIETSSNFMINDIVRSSDIANM